MTAVAKRYLQPHVLNWLVNELGLGMGIGNIFYMAPASGTMEAMLEANGVPNSHIYHTLTTAYAATTANQNDVILVTPGSYVETAEVAWSKDWTHLVGMGGPNTGGDYSLASCTIYTSTTQVAELIDITGDRCQFHNVQLTNAGAHAENLAAVNVDGWGCYFKNVTIQGTMTTEQAAVATAGSLFIDRLGHFPIFEDCIIGQNTWATRTAANSGVLRFVGTTVPAPVNGLFRRCTFLSRAETATIAMVALPANTCLDRIWMFDNCHFDNFWAGSSNKLNQAFYDICATSHAVVLNNCTATWISEWQSGAGFVYQTMPTAAALGGIATTST